MISLRPARPTAPPPRSCGTLAALLCSTALQAALIAGVPVAALAQSPTALPTGGQVSAGAASIAQSATSTTITQSSQRAAINWTSYNIGSGNSVVYHQPDSSAVVLNRVTGPDPSRIAGSIQANGQVVITNASGVYFSKGAQVNAQGLVVSAAGITNQNFMTGRMIFDQAPNPNAAIVNAGTLTMAQAGDAALVAPRVANSGIITARLGHVILAGAQTQTLDMYGDGLLSIDVTRQVTTAPVGRHGRSATALVTNTGTIVADGGSVQLTAAAVDGVVRTLVDAGGTIRADSVGGHSGLIAVNGVGGSITIDGALLARGRSPGSSGGAIELNATRTVRVGAQARIDASGAAGGGTVAIGTTLARARGGASVVAPTAARTIIAKGARISANATRSGAGGRITVLSRRRTVQKGQIAATGGPSGGDGGFVEISGATVNLAGPVTVAAPLGQLGTILLDPQDLTIASTGANVITPAATSPNIGYDTDGTGTDATVTPAALEALTGNIDLQASRNLVVASSFTSAGSVSLEAGNDLTVNAGVTIGSSGSVGLAAAVNFGGEAPQPGYSAAGALSVLGDIAAASGDVQLSAGTGGITLGGNIAGNVIGLATSGAVQQSGGVLTTSELSFTAGSLSLGDANLIAGTAGAGSGEGTTATTTGGILITEAAGQNLTVIGQLTVPTGQNITLNTDLIQVAQPEETDVASNVTVNAEGGTAISAAGGTVTIAPVTPGRPIELIGTEAATAGRLSLNQALLNSITATTLAVGNASAGPIFVGAAGDTVAPTNVATLSLLSGGAISEGGVLDIATLEAAGASIALGAAGNAIATLGSATATGVLTVASGGDLLVSGPVSGSSVALSGFSLTLAGNITGGNVDLSSSGTAELIQNAGVITATTLTGTDPSAALNDNNAISALGNFTTFFGGFSLTNVVPLTVAGTVQTSDGDITLTQTGPLAIAAGGTLSAPNYTVALNVTGGAIAEAQGGAILADALTGSAGAAALTSTANQVNELDDFATSSGGFALTDAASLNIGGVISVPTGQTLALSTDNLDLSDSENAEELLAPGGIIAIAPLTPGRPIALNGFSIDQPDTLNISDDLTGVMQAATLQLGSAAAGPISIGPAGDDIYLTGVVTTLNLISAGAISQGGALTVDTLTGSAASVSLGLGNAINILGNFTTTGGFALINDQPLAVTGTLTDPGSIAITTQGQMSLSGALTAADITLVAQTYTPPSEDYFGPTAAVPGSITQTAGSVNASATLSLTADTTISQTGGVLTGGTLTGSSGGATLLASTSNSLTDLGGFTSSGGFTLVDTPALTVSGPVSDSASIALSDATSLLLTGELTAPSVSLAATGAIQQTSGGIAATTLSGQAGSAALGGANAVATLGAFATSGAFSLNDATGLLVSGPVAAAGLTLADAGAIMLTGDVTAQSLAITAGGTIDQSGGSLMTSTLAGSAVGGAAFGASGAVATIGALGAFTVSGGDFSLDDSHPLTISGPLSANSIGISAPIQILLEGGGLEISAAPGTPASILEVTAGAGGAGALNQTGTTTVSALTGPGTVALAVSAAGGISLNTLAAPSTQLTLASNGAIAGTLAVAGLLIEGQSGSATLFGTVDGVAGGPAAAIAGIAPAINDLYLLNGCVIAAASCGTMIETSPPPPPPPPPNQPEISVGALPSTLLPPRFPGLAIPELLPLPPISFPVDLAEPDITLPNISSKDY